jgi:Tfp pilus assembly protein PilX
MMARSARFNNRKTRAHGRGRSASLSARNDKGVALLISLMLLTLMSIMSVVMVMTVSPDMLINGYYGNFRGSFYAADSGLNMARQQLVNQIKTQLNVTPCTGWGGTGGCTNTPLSASSATTVMNNVLATTGGYGGLTSLNLGQAVNSWPGSFQILATNNSTTNTCVSTFTLPNNPVGNTPNSQGQITQYTYTFNYQLCSLGRALGSQQVYTAENGYISLTVQANTTTTQQTTVSFSSFGAFINNYPPCTGALVPGTMEGPMFTNGAWQFGNNGAYIFTDPVGQANANADYYCGSSCNQSAASSYSSGSCKIAPTFPQGLKLGQAAVALPSNDFSQQWAVIDGKGCGEGGSTCNVSAPPSPANSDLHAALMDINKNAYPSNGASTGVFLPYSCVGSACTMNGGGIYVEGNATVVLSPSTDGSGNLTQVYTITQGSTTTTITTNPTANTTTISSGSTNRVLTGVPMNKLLATPTPATMLYVDGTVSLSGPTGQSNQGQPAIQDGSQVTVAAGGNVNITGDIVYKHEPVTMDTSNTLIPANDTNQVLGIFTASGNINLSSPYSNNNLQVDGALAAVGQNCASNSCGFTVSGSINTFNNVGGQIQSNIFSANMQTENTYFDRRFTSKPGFAPPWFPSTSVPLSDITNALPPTIPNPPTITRMSWSTTPQ